MGQIENPEFTSAQIAKFIEIEARLKRTAEQAKLTRKRYRTNNKNKVYETNKSYRMNNKDKVTEARRSYRAVNKDRIAKYYKSYGPKYIQENRERLRPAKIAAEYRWRNRPDPEYRTRYLRYTAKKQGLVYNYEELYTIQEGLCAICKGDNNGKPLHVDHNHTTKVVRGLLCGSCNRGLGLFYESVDRLQLAITYLEKETKK